MKARKYFFLSRSLLCFLNKSFQIFVYCILSSSKWSQEIEGQETRFFAVESFDARASQDYKEAETIGLRSFDELFAL